MREASPFGSGSAERALGRIQLKKKLAPADSLFSTTRNRRSPPATQQADSSPSKPTKRSAATSTSTRGAATRTGQSLQATASTSAQDAGKITALSGVRKRRLTEAKTPLILDAWKRLLEETRLIDSYPDILQGIRSGFCMGMPTIRQNYHPFNTKSADAHADILQAEVDEEIAQGRYLGPYSASTIIAVLGPFQSSPQSVIEKPNKPGSYRLIRNLSAPISPFPGPLGPILSINSQLDVSAHPCSWGTFYSFCVLVASLPEGSEMAIRDVRDAFRSVPLHPDQWPGHVVRVAGEDQFVVDTAVSFGGAPAPGLYGHVADAALDILRAKGIGPSSKWVDDHAFIRIKRKYIENYNTWRAEVRNRISVEGGERRKGARIWWEGGEGADGRREEFVENFRFPIRAVGDSESEFAYQAEDVDSLFAELGVVLAEEKGCDFAPVAPFTGLEWNVQAKQVGVPEKKREKYAAVLETLRGEAEPGERWGKKAVESLYGKLMHVSLVVPEGRAYLTSLEAMLGGWAVPGARPFATRSVSGDLRADLKWWADKLSKAVPARPLPVPVRIIDAQAFSDASSGVGIGVWIAGFWRAWRFRPGWRSGGKDIQWAEAVGFELLSHTLLAAQPALGGSHVWLYGDNTSVVEGWWNYRSRNAHVNRVFKRVHTFAAENHLDIHTRYVRSALNPADAPSRGIYGPTNHLLPRVPLSGELAEFLIDCDDARAHRSAVPLSGAFSKPASASARPTTRPAEEDRDRAAAEAAIIFQSSLLEDA